MDSPCDSVLRLSSRAALGCDVSNEAKANLCPSAVDDEAADAGELTIASGTSAAFGGKEPERGGLTMDGADSLAGRPQACDSRSSGDAGSSTPGNDGFITVCKGASLLSPCPLCLGALGIALAARNLVAPTWEKLVDL